MNRRCDTPIARHRRLITWLVLVSCGAVSVPHLQADIPRALPAGELPRDARLGPLKDLNGYFPLFVPSSADAWKKRAESVRRRVLVSLGLWPMPSKAPLRGVVHGKIEQAEYTIEKVFFESMPGFFVTGNLYRPRSGTGKRPGILCPHGHWSDGRLTDAGRDSVRKEIAQGAERFEDGGRSPLQSRCVQLARMGCVVFHWDMIGYADSQQISNAVAHRFAKQRPKMNRRVGWGLYSPQAESRFQSVMGLQALSSIRALDFLLSLPDVDRAKIAVTGASGGGTQTFILSAIDPRVTVSFPAVMVSTAMQGGCTCENACGLRVGTGNVEFAALFAPKPLGMTAANDWTKEMPTKGFPELTRLFTMLGAEQNVMLKPLLHFGHNYNYVSRASMYAWLNERLDLGLPEPIVEESYHRLSKAELTVWDQEHPQPAGGPQFERDLLRWWDEDVSKQLDSLLPSDARSSDDYRKVVAAGIDVVVGRRLPEPESLEFEEVKRTELDDAVQITGLLTHHLTGRDTIALSNDGLQAKVQEQLPVVALLPSDRSGRVCIWISAKGKRGLFDTTGRPIKPIRKLLRHGIVVCGVDLFQQGEFLPDGKPMAKLQRFASGRESAAYTFGYNPSLFARRVHDILSAIAQVRDYGATEIDLVGLDGSGSWVAAARAQAEGAVRRAAIDTRGFRFAAVDDLRDPRFLPGGAKYHDLPGMLAVAAPAKLWLAGEGDSLPSPVAAAYRAADAEGEVQLGPGEQPVEAAVDWLLNQ